LSRIDRAKKELIEGVADDLRLLHEDWGDAADDHTLRRGSTLLRRLLVDAQLQRAWKGAGFEKEPEIEGGTLKEILKIVPVQEIALASVGGAKYEGGEIRGLMSLNNELGNAEAYEMAQAALATEKLGLRGWTEGACMVVQGIPVPRRVLVKFISNKLGGAHFDASRGASLEERQFALLDEVRERLRLMGKDAVYFELLSVGQTLAASMDVQRFLERVDLATEPPPP